MASSVEKLEQLRTDLEPVLAELVASAGAKGKVALAMARPVLEPKIDEWLALGAAEVDERLERIVRAVASFRSDDAPQLLVAELQLEAPAT